MKNWGGHFTPELGGQFELESGGHFKLELGGQYHRNMQYSYYFDFMDILQLFKFENSCESIPGLILGAVVSQTTYL